MKKTALVVLSIAALALAGCKDKPKTEAPAAAPQGQAPAGQPGAAAPGGDPHAGMKAQEIERESNDVAAAIDVEILRHYDDHLARKAELDHDLAVKKAIEVLSDSTKYASTLHPPVPVK